MRIVLYTESFINLDKLLMEILSNGHNITTISSQDLKLPKDYWHIDNAEVISGSFFVIEQFYRPFFGNKSLEFLPFDLVLCCKNIKDIQRAKSHSISCNIPFYDFDPGEKIDIESFLMDIPKQQREKIEILDKNIRFNIITPVYNTNLIHLKECVKSVVNQYYDNFHWIIINDGSNELVTKSLKKYQQEFPDLISIHHYTENKGVAIAISKALKFCNAEYICFLDSDDILEPNCLYEIKKYIEKNRDKKFIYTNERQIDFDGEIIEDIKKPDFNLELFYQTMYINHMKIIHRDILREIGYPNLEYGGSWDYDYFLRISENIKVGHIRKILYRWRRRDYKGGFMDEGRQMIHHEKALKAIRQSNKRKGLIKGRIIPTEIPWHYKIERDIQNENKFVKILILTKCKINYLKLLLDSVEREVKYKNYKIIIIQHTDIEDKDMSEFLENTNHENHRCDFPGFNYSRITNWILDNFVDKNDDYVLILNDDIIFQTDCVSEMIACMQNDDKCGIVGCKLLWPDKEFKFYTTRYSCWPMPTGKIQHAGVKLHSDKCCSHSYYGYNSQYLAANYMKEVDAVTFACVMIKKEIFDKVRFSKKLPIDFNDIAFCIDAKELGYKIYYTPWAVALHWESVTKEWGRREDFRYFQVKYGKILNKYKTLEEARYEEEFGI